MANNGYFVFTPGYGSLGVILLGEDRSTRWNSTALVSISSIASSAWDTGVIAAIEQLTEDDQPTGIYVYNVPSGIAAQELLGLFYSTTTPAFNATPIGSQLLPWTGSLVATLDDVATAWTTAMTEAYAGNGSPMTPAEALHMIYAVCAQFTVSGTGITAKKLDGSTAALTFIMDSATAPTERTRSG
jgi:hypothetical protein